MNHTFTVSQNCRAVATIEAEFVADAVKQYAAQHGYTAVLPLRDEQPTRVFTHNGQSDYTARQWSATLLTGRDAVRVYVRD